MSGIGIQFNAAGEAVAVDTYYNRKGREHVKREWLVRPSKEDRRELIAKIAKRRGQSQKTSAVSPYVQ